MATVSSSASPSVIAPVEAVLREIFEKYSKLYDGGLSLEEFAHLLLDTRGLPLERATAEASSLFATFESADYVDSDEEFLGYPAFARHILTTSNIQEQHKTPLDLKQPLTHYLIKSISAGADYYHPRDLRKVLHDGFRWIEWNCYVDQVNNQPVFASHASSATQLGIRKALEIIVQDGFRTTSLPLILSINVFCSFDHQSKLASWLKSELGDLLAKLPRKRGQVPTPAELQNKVLLCVVDTPTAVSTNIQSLLLPDSVTCIATSRRALDAELTARQAFPYPAAAELVELAHFSHQDQPNTDTAEYRSVCAIPEAIAAPSPLSVVQYTSRCLLHQTPLPQRFAFSNQNPQLGWSLGAQVADVNPFVNDAVSQLNHGVFSQYAQCGYTLKPFGMRSPPFIDPSHEINLNCQLCIDFFGLNDVMKNIRCPVVSLEAQVHGHASEAVFFKISNLSLFTTWKESVVLHLNKSSTSILRLSLVDQSTGSAVAYFCASVNSLLTGLRVIPLTAVLSHRPIEAGLLCMVTLGDEKPQSTLGELGRFSSLHRQSTNLSLLKKDQPKSILKKKEKPVDPNAPKKRDWVSLRKTPSQLQPKRRVPMPPMETLVKTITNAEVDELRELAAALHLPENLHRDDSSPDEALACVLQVVNTLHVSRDKQVRFLLPTDHEARVRRRAARNALKKWVRKVRPGATSHRPAPGGGIDADKIPTKATAESKEAQQKRAARQWGDKKMATAALGTEREQIVSDSDSDEEDLTDSEEWYSSEEEDDEESGDLSENPFDFSGFSGALGMRLDTLQEQDLAQDIRAANVPLSPATSSELRDLADKKSVSSTSAKEREEETSSVSSVSSSSASSSTGATSAPLDADKKPKKGSAIRPVAGGKARLISMGYSSSNQNASTTRETLDDDVQTEEEEKEEYDYESEEFTDEEVDPHEPVTTTTTSKPTEALNRSESAGKARVRGIGRVEALYDYANPRNYQDHLTFQRGDNFVLLAKLKKDWWIGQFQGVRGIFPACYTREVHSVPKQLSSGSIDLTQVKPPSASSSSSKASEVSSNPVVATVAETAALDQVPSPRTRLRSMGQRVADIDQFQSAAELVIRDSKRRLG